MYPEMLIAPMRQELTRLGVQELKTPDEVQATLSDTSEPTLLVVNSMCGCAARNARPAVALALQNEKKPAKLTTVFAGQDQEATAAARAFIHGYPPSSPSIALLKDGEVAHMIPRHQIEGRTAEDIAQDLVEAFNRYC
ncbi:BrxA/BrxB family bacilliredoxin [Longimicrobium sp.]|jgi:putative YphP/YqiW family bacilliredoxin|uniref:BrxA/BrxB family bacilliredoxin n=1 Tax=Longimicrobium sp. TaxID=2029185 RepID=UPI0032C2303E